MLASLVTPHGWRLWSFLATELTNPYNGRYIFEWYPAWRAPGFSEGVAAALLVIGLGAFLLAGLGRPTGRGRYRLWQFLLAVLPVVGLAAQSVRHIPLFAIWAAPAFTAGLQAAVDRWETRRPNWTRQALLVLLALVALPGLLTLFNALRDPAPRIRITEHSLGKEAPLGAVRFMQANQLQGNVYTPLWWGSYLTWELYPDILVSMDGRNDTLYPVEMVGENLAYYLEEEIDPDVPLRYPTDFVLAPASSAAATALAADPAWHLLYQDDQAVLFVRNDEAHARMIAQAEAGQLHPPEGPLPIYFPSEAP